MDQADSELRGTIKQIWPIQAKKMIDLLVPPKNMLNTGKMTVGKIYAGVLLLETWRNNKCVQLECDAPDLQDRKSHEIQEAYIDDGHLHPGHDPRGAHRRSPSIQYGTIENSYMISQLSMTVLQLILSLQTWLSTGPTN